MDNAVYTKILYYIIGIYWYILYYGYILIYIILLVYIGAWELHKDASYCFQQILEAV